jgi:hypothetical protein
MEHIAASSETSPLTSFSFDKHKKEVSMGNERGRAALAPANAYMSNP